MRDPKSSEKQFMISGEDHPYRSSVDPYDEMKASMISLAAAIEERLAFRDQQYRRLERSVGNHFRADMLFIVLLQVVCMIILKIWGVY